MAARGGSSSFEVLPLDTCLLSRRCTAIAHPPESCWADSIGVCEKLMPALSWDASLSDAIVSHGGNLSVSLASATNATNPVKVICAWPVSGQYGAGSRVLYYVLIAACLFARREIWIKNACLAAALLLPAVAAVHGIVLAALHRDKAVDMDIYGAFQLCSIGVLVVPVTVRLSETYRNTPGRNTIFLWAGLLLAGLLSLTIEFYRAQTFPCSQDAQGNPIPSNPSKFPYGESTTCGLVCSETEGPFSPMRKGSSSDIYVVPAPSRLTFGTATLIAAACCVHTIVWMASMAEMVFEDNWKSPLGIRTDDGQADEQIPGTNGATKNTMRDVNAMIRFFLSVVAVPVFGGAGLAILIIGEINFFSGPVSYQVESLASIGQWSPIVGTGLAVIGSLYLVLAADVNAVKEESGSVDACPCTCCSHHGFEPDNLRGQSRALSSSSGSTPGSHSSEDGYATETPGSSTFPEMRQTDTESAVPLHNVDRVQTTQTTASTNASVAMQRHTSSNSTVRPPSTTGSSSRRRVARIIVSVGETLGSKAHNLVDDSEFRRGKAVDWPETPGESWRNQRLRVTRALYNPSRDADGNATPLPRSPSRAGSSRGDAIGRSPRPGLSPSRSHSPTRPPPAVARQQRAGTMPETSTFTCQDHRPPPLPLISQQRQRARSDTLEVPSASHHISAQSHYPQAVMSGGRGSLQDLQSSDGGDDEKAPAVRGATAPAVSSPDASPSSSSL
ncbi:hypothetical protein TgHK011_008685 [Trichoderma gracile]|nr:hypothetical protein TgHK011_008685 [Trichoderma gracile]